MKPLVIWTRPAKDWRRDEKIIAGRFPVISVPAIKLKSIAPKELKLKQGVVIISSVNALDFLQSQVSSLKSFFGTVKIFCFGPRTGERLEQIGLSAHPNYDCRSLKELCEWVALEHNPSHVTYLGAKNPATPIDSSFTSRGIGFEHVTLYETRECDIKNQVEDLATSHQPLLITVASPSAARAALAACENIMHQNIEFLCIGTTTSACLAATANRVTVSEAPAIESLATAAVEWYKGVK